LATAPALVDAYRAARDADAMSAFGGIVALNRPVDAATANVIAETFIECVLAPSLEEDALACLRKQKALRILATGQWLAADYEALQFKRVGGGVVIQARARTAPGEVRQGRGVTKRQPAEAELSAMEFAWTACKP